MAPPFSLVLLLACLQETPPLSRRVNDAIAGGVQYLRSRQSADGSWPGYEAEHPGGTTALAAYALLKSGVAREDPSLTRAWTTLRYQEFRSIYSCSVLLLFLEAHGPSEQHGARAKGAVQFLVENQQDGVWAYPWGSVDMNNVQFALLGLRAAHRIGVPTPRETLQRCAGTLWRFQARDGGFCYAPDRLPTGGITMATLGGLELLADWAEEDRALAQTLRKHKQEHAEARRWLDEHFDIERNRMGPRAFQGAWYLEYLWSLERYGAFSENKEIAGVDWYQEGAEVLVGRQAREGSWGVEGHRLIEDTCFALLFLRRASMTGTSAAPEGSTAAFSARPAPVVPAADIPRLREWLVAGPFRDPGINEAIADPPFPPGRVRPRRGAALGREKWREVTLEPGGWTDLDKVPGPSGDRQIWALGAYIEVDESLAEVPALLWMSLEDGWNVYFAGEPVSLSQRIGAPILETISIPVLLKAGKSPLLILVEDVGGAAAFGARITQPDGSALPPGVRVTTDP